MSKGQREAPAMQDNIYILPVREPIEPKKAPTHHLPTQLTPKRPHLRWFDQDELPGDCEAYRCRCDSKRICRDFTPGDVDVEDRFWINHALVRQCH